MAVVSGFQTTSAGSGTDGDTLVVTRTGSIAYTPDVAVFMSGDNQKTTIFGEVFSGEGRAILSQGDNAFVYVAEGGNVSGKTGIQTGDNAFVQNAGTIQASGGGYAIAMDGRLHNSGTILGEIVIRGNASAINTGSIFGTLQIDTDAPSYTQTNSGYLQSFDSRAASTYFTNTGEVVSFYAAAQLELFNSGTIGSLRFDDGAGYIVNTGYIGGRRADFSSEGDYYDGRGGVITGNVYAGEGNDTLLGGAQTDHFDGQGGADRLFGYGGDDELTGGDGDRLAGGADDDLYILDFGGTGTAKLVERAGGGIDTVRTFASYKLGAQIENLELVGTDLSGTGNALDNILTGDGGNSILDGKAGFDELYGGTGNDTLIGGKGTDELYGEAGLDTFVFLAGDTSKVRDEADTIHGFLQSDSDRIDLSQFDANSKKKGIQDFDFIGSDAFSKTASELRFVTQGNDTWVSGDVNGDGKADFMIRLDSAVVLQDANFLL